MNSRHLVDPELDSFLDTYQPLEPSREALPQIRQQRASAILDVLRDLPPDSVTKTEHHVPGIQGAPPVRVLVYSPQNIRRPAPTYMNIHGGGMIVGMPEQDEACKPPHRRRAGLHRRLTRISPRP